MTTKRIKKKRFKQRFKFYGTVKRTMHFGYIQQSFPRRVGVGFITAEGKPEIVSFSYPPEYP